MKIKKQSVGCIFAEQCDCRAESKVSEGDDEALMSDDFMGEKSDYLLKKVFLCVII